MTGRGASRASAGTLAPHPDTTVTGRAPWCALVLLLAILAASLAFLLAWPADDDALIYGRFALHLARGEGAVWNPGGEAVEGFSSATWMALAALSARLGGTPHVALRVLSLAAGALAVIATAWLARAAGGSRRLALGAAAGLAFQYWFLVWAQSGLETAWMTALLAGSLALWLRRRSRLAPPPGWGAAGLVGGGFAVLAFTRPEGAIAPLLALATDLAAMRRGSTDPRFARRWATVFLGLLGGGLLARRLYFDAWTPNTSLKVYPLHLERSVPQALEFIAWTGGALVLAVLARAVRRGAGAAPHRALAGIALAVSFGFHFAVGGDYRPGLRYLIPALPLLVVAGLLEIRTLASARLPAGRGLAAVLGLAVLSVVAPSLPALGRDLSPLPTMGAVLERWRHPFDHPDWGNQTARWIADQAPQGALVAYGQMGRAPYLAALRRHDLDFLDTVGWVSKAVGDIYRPAAKVRHLAVALAGQRSLAEALESGRRARARAFVDLVLARRPELVLLEEGMPHAGLRALAEDHRFLAEYRYLVSLETGPRVAVWRRREAPAAVAGPPTAALVRSPG